MARRPRTPVPGAPGISSYIDAQGRKKYMVRYRTAEGRQTDKQGLPTLTAARNFQAQTRVNINGGTFTPEAKKATKIAALWPAFIATKQGLRPRPQRNLESAWETHVKVRWGHISVGRITRAAVQEWTNELAETLSPSRVKDVVGVLRGILRTAVHDGVMPTDPTVGVTTPKRRGKLRRRYLSADEARAMVTIFLFIFVATWNNFLLPLMMISSPELKPVTLGLYGMMSYFSPDKGAVMLGALLGVIPLVILFLFLQRYWQSGLAAGAVKG